MLCLVIGQSASGKSRLAEELVCSLPGRRVYLAAMQPFGEEARARIARHRRLRAGRGFGTLECAGGLAKLLEREKGCKSPAGAFGEPLRGSGFEAEEMFAAGAPAEKTDIAQPADPENGICLAGANLLLEDLPNLLANAMFSDNGDDPEGLFKLLLDLSRHSGSLTIVTGDLLSGGLSYGEETLAYLRRLAALERQLAEAADLVLEAAAGLFSIRKLSPEADLPEAFISGKLPPRREALRDSESSGESFRSFGMSEAPAGCREALRDSGSFVESLRSFGMSEAPAGCREALRDSESSGESLRKSPAGDEKREVQPMILIVGPFWSGKSELAERIAASKGEELRYVGREELSLPREEGVCRILRGAGELAAGLSEEELPALAKELSRADIVISDEMGGGVVPIDPAERAAREAAGRLTCLLAQRAGTVLRVIAGLPELLKGDPSGLF